MESIKDISNILMSFENLQIGGYDFQLANNHDELIMYGIENNEKITIYQRSTFRYTNFILSELSPEHIMNLINLLVSKGKLPG
jgi:hypothetical protein